MLNRSKIFEKKTMGLMMVHIYRLELHKHFDNLVKLYDLIRFYDDKCIGYELLTFYVCFGVCRLVVGVF